MEGTKDRATDERPQSVTLCCVRSGVWRWCRRFSPGHKDRLRNAKSGKLQYLNADEHPDTELLTQYHAYVSGNKYLYANQARREMMAVWNSRLPRSMFISISDVCMEPTID